MLCHIRSAKINLEKPEEKIQNGHPIDTDSIGLKTQNEDKKKQKQNTESKMMDNTDPPKMVDEPRMLMKGSSFRYIRCATPHLVQQENTEVTKMYNQR